MERLDRLRSFLKDRQYGTAVITKPANVAALFRGAQASLGFRQEPPGRIAVCVNLDSIVLLGNRTEVRRVAEDELSWLPGLVTEPYRWDEWDMKTTVKAYLDARGIAPVCDDRGAFGENIGPFLEAMHYPLTDRETDDLRQLAGETATIVESVAKTFAPSATEVEVAGELGGRLVVRGIWPELVMVAADERIHAFRHINPKEIPIRGLGFLSVTVHRRGLYVSLTRLVSLGPVPAAWRLRQAACNRVDARAISLSIEGACVGDIFQAMQESYAREGYPEEWEAHHQGGPAGFSGRDYKATSGERRSLSGRQPLVWNPTIEGAKSEDTILTTVGGGLPEILTETGGWVYFSAASPGGDIRRPGILER